MSVSPAFQNKQVSTSKAKVNEYSGIVFEDENRMDPMLRYLILVIIICLLLVIGCVLYIHYTCLL